MAVAKIAAGLVAVGGVATAATIAMVSGTSSVVPKCHFLYEDTGYETKTGTGQEYNDKYAATYGRYLVGVSTKQEGQNTTNNDAWWEWAFKNLFIPKKDQAKGKFKELDKANKTSKDLKDTCAAAYKEKNASNEKILGQWPTSGDETTNKDKFLESNIWLYCSPFETKVTTIKESYDSTAQNPYNGTNDSSNKYGKKYEAKMVASKNGANKWFWNLKLEELKSNSDWSDGTNQNNKFKDLHNKLNQPNSQEKGDVRALCEAAYSQDEAANGTSEYPKKEVFKFCSLTAKE